MSTMIQAGEFKARCLAILDEVAETGQQVIVTKRGKPVARLVPLDSPPTGSLLGSVRYAEDTDDLLSADEVWDVEA